MINVDEFIEHVGVKGMRWGSRKGASGTSGKPGKRQSTEAKRAGEILKKAKKTGVRSLTNKELGDLNKRLQLERSFASIGPKSTLSKGANHAKTILTVGKTLNEVVAFSNSPVGIRIQKSMGKKLTSKEKIVRLQKLDKKSKYSKSDYDMFKKISKM